MRKQLIGTATSGKNEVAQGFMGKIRDIIDRAFLSDKLGDLPDSYMRGVVVTSDIGADDLMTYSLTANMISWSMRKLQGRHGERAGRQRGSAERMGRAGKVDRRQYRG
jgi:hypothetical protein